MVCFTKVYFREIVEYLRMLQYMYLWGSSSRLWKTTAGRSMVAWPRTLDTAYEVRIDAARSSADLRDQVRRRNSRGSPCQPWYSGWAASGRRTPISSQSPRRERSALETLRSCSIPALRLQRKQIGSFFSLALLDLIRRYRRYIFTAWIDYTGETY